MPGGASKSVNQKTAGIKIAVEAAVDRCEPQHAVVWIGYTGGIVLCVTLAPQTTGASDATLKGEITGTIAVGDNLTLNFCEPDYGKQDGTLASIAARCDFATATVAVESTDNGIITTTAASFISQQAIVEFTLKKSDGTAFTGGVTSLKVVAGTEITVTPSSATNVLYVAIPAVDARTISLMATTSSDDDGYTRSGVTFEKGKYYKITVRMEVVPKYANSAISIPIMDLQWITH